MLKLIETRTYYEMDYKGHKFLVENSTESGLKFFYIEESYDQVEDEDTIKYLTQEYKNQNEQKQQSDKEFIDSYDSWQDEPGAKEYVADLESHYLFATSLKQAEERIHKLVELNEIDVTVCNVELIS